MPLEGKLDEILHVQQECLLELREYRAARKASQQNVDRFWSRDWPQLIQKIDDVGTKVADVDHRVRQLEINTTPIPDSIEKLKTEQRDLARKQSRQDVAMVIVGLVAFGDGILRIVALF